MIRIITTALLCIVMISIFDNCESKEKTIKNMYYKYDRAKIETRVREHAWRTREYNRTHYIDTEYIFLVDFSIPSGFNRLFLYDYTKDSIIFESLVAHGSGYGDTNATWDGVPKLFSNLPESHLSSLGRYVILDRGASSWGVGIKYTLEGLDSTNIAAMSRDIVLHSWQRIPNEEIYPMPIVESWGCPAVSDSTFRVIDGVVYYRPLPMMMWIYD